MKKKNENEEKIVKKTIESARKIRKKQAKIFKNPEKTIATIVWKKQAENDEQLTKIAKSGKSGQ